MSSPISSYLSNLWSAASHLEHAFSSKTTEAQGASKAQGVDSKAGRPTSPLPAGVAAHRSAKAFAPFFIAPGDLTDGLISPKSQNMLMQHSPLLRSVDQFLGDRAVEGSSPPEHLYSPDLAKRFLDTVGRNPDVAETSTLVEAHTHWRTDKNSALALKSIAGCEPLYRAMSRLMVSSHRNFQIEHLSRHTLDQNRTEGDGLDLVLTLSDMLGHAVPGGGRLWDLLSGRYPTELGSDQRNYLITLVKIGGETQLKFFSVSGEPKVELDNENRAVFYVGPKRSPNISTLKASVLLNQSQKGTCKVQENFAQLRPSKDAPVLFLSYPDITTGVLDDRLEARVLPRTFKMNPEGKVQDRVRDSEYATMTALKMIASHHADALNGPVEIIMFSRHKMCSSCESATSVALTKPAFAKVSSFRIYS